MSNSSEFKKRKLMTAWTLLGLGLALLAAGMIVRYSTPIEGFSYKWFSSFGIFFAGWGAFELARRLITLRDPLAARREAIEEKDERSRTIRLRAGNAAFYFTMVIAWAALLIYSNLTSGQPGFDPVWTYLAFAFVGPILFYSICLVWFNQRS